ncbi:Tim44 domain-containing protein [Roseateles sp.]|uniref:Tim44 domain-containing protein n=1 Tax=Roseateles sp. TaxID=1971397 RepID=UPI00286C740A|nr:TIM44-like domain-containing protein [Roseateles sp.]
MKQILISAIVAVLALGVASFDSEAKRLGSGGSSGMKRTAPTQTTDASKGTPAQQAAPTAAAAAPATAAAAAAPKRNWMGPIAGLAAGLGIAALASHFGMGGALANMMTMLLIGVVVMLVIGFVMRRMRAGKQPAAANLQGMQFAGAGAPFQAPQQLATPPFAAPAMPTATAAAPAATADGFDTAGFEQLAKRVFIRLQAANDNGDQADLRRFTTPEMYGVVQQELLERKGARQSTEVLQLDARVIERVQEHGKQIVSVRFWGLIREQSEAAAENFDEVWHLVRPVDESQEWAIAGIQASN